MNVLVVDKSRYFADVLENFLHDSSKTCNLVYCQSFSTFSLSEHNNDVDITFVSLDSVSSQDINYISKYSKLIGVSPDSKTTRKYINCPSFQRIFQKPLDLVSVIKYLDNYIEPGLIKKNLNVSVLNMLSKVGFTVNNNGTIYLAECIVESKRNYYIKLVDIAEIIAKRNNTTSKNVIWAIRNAINRTVGILGEDKIEKYFRLYDGRRPTAKYLIEFYANMI